MPDACGQIGGTTASLAPQPLLLLSRRESGAREGPSVARRGIPLLESFRLFPLLDLYVLRHFLLAFIVCFTSFLALYVVIDLFTKIDEFAVHAEGIEGFLGNVGTYYLYRLPWFFQRLSGVLALLAAVFTLIWLEHQNEVIAWLAAGIPGRRLLYPVLGATVGVIALSVVNREIIIPECSPYLQRSAEDPRGTKQVMVQGTYDQNLIHFEGGVADPRRQIIQDGRLTFPSDQVGGLLHVYCREMHFRPAQGNDDSGWYLFGTTPSCLDGLHPSLDWLQDGTHFLHTDLTFRRLTRSANWFQYEPTADLLSLLKLDHGAQRRSEVIVLLHRRLTGPMLEFLLVLLGVSFVQVGYANRKIIAKLGLVFLIYAIFQGVQFVSGGLAQQEYVDPILAAWLPVLIFGPVAVAWLDGARA